MTTPDVAALDALRREFDVTETELAIDGNMIRLAHPRDAEALIDEREFAEDERLPYWADIWPSATVLAELVARLDGRGRTLLELGCGVGLVSIAAARAGFTVTASDYYDDALRFAAYNVGTNARSAIVTRLIDWRALPEDLAPFDVVVASDVLYERPYATLVASAFARTIAHGGEGWLTDPGRIATPAFVEQARGMGLSCERVREEAVQANARTQRIGVYRIAR